MNKSDFLEELERCLAVLDVREQQDILEEYTQHIDLKTESGLSEEEAIRDFGDLHQLAAEILEAYHVNPDYNKNRERSGRNSAAAGSKRAREAFPGFFKMISRCLHRTGAAFCRCWRAFLEKIHSWSAGIRTHRRPAFLRRPKGSGQELISASVQDTGTDREQRPLHRAGIGFRRAGAGFGRVMKNTSRGMGAFLGGCLSLAVCCLLFCLRWAWNIILITLALLSGCLALTSLFIFAAVIVWLAQGYPLAGVTLLCLGSVLCCGSFTVLCISLLRFHKKRTADPAVNRLTAEEVQHA